MTIRMGYWDCPSCKTTKNLGPNPTCMGCGLPRGPKIPFYTDDSAPTVEDPELVARARAGADWKCKYCGADNRAGVMDCHQCGAGPDGSVKRSEAVQMFETPKPASGNGKKILLIALGVIATLVFGIYFAFVRTSALEMTVESASWIKTAQLEVLETNKSQAWADEVPGGARTLKEETKERTKKVKDGTTKVKVGRKDLGNGMFEDIYKEEPKYVDKKVDDSWVTYEADEWSTKETLRSESTDGKEPKDPAAGVSVGAKQRIGATTNAAVFKLKGSNGKSYTFDVDVAEAGPGAVTKYEVGGKYTAKVNGMGAVVSMGP